MPLALQVTSKGGNEGGEKREERGEKMRVWMTETKPSQSNRGFARDVADSGMQAVNNSLVRGLLFTPTIGLD